VGVREIVTAGAPVLRRVADPVDPATVSEPALQGLIDDLIDTMRAAGGAGLAAPQIGVPLAVAVVEVADNPRYPYKPPIPLTVLVNPVIEPVGEETALINEGCLSVPGLRGVLPRFVRVDVRYLDRHGAPRRERRVGLAAGTFQHEVDHLNGILFLDRVEDPRTLMTWESFERFHREAFLASVAGLPR
jgi:peptide deformylase